MAEYEEFTSSQCTAADFNRVITSFVNAAKSRSVTVGENLVTKGTPMLASQIEYYRAQAFNILNYSSFISAITKGTLIQKKHIECISQATSDLNNLLRCRSGCTGNCYSICTGTCTSSCAGSTHHAGSCSGLTWWCSGDCNNYCSGTCSGDCDGTCGRGCNAYCVSSCKNSSTSSTNRLVGTSVSL